MPVSTCCVAQLAREMEEAKARVEEELMQTELAAAASDKRAREVRCPGLMILGPRSSGFRGQSGLKACALRRLSIAVAHGLCSDLCLET